MTGIQPIHLKNLPCDIPSYALNLKVIVLGNRTELATLAELEENLYSFADYAEIESYISVAEVEEQKNLGELCTTNGSRAKY